MTGSPDAARALADVQAAAHAVAAAMATLDTARERRRGAMAAARALGVTSGAIAAAAQVSPGRVSQLRPDGLDEALAVPALPEGPLMAERGSRRTARRYAERPTAWVSATDGHGIGPDGAPFRAQKETVTALLDSLPPPVARVYITGDMRDLAGDSWDDVRRWGTTGVEGSRWTPGQHWTDKGTPIFRWTGGASHHLAGPVAARAVEILSADGWCGTASPEDCARTWRLLAEDVRRVIPGGQLLSTPATTGRDLWLRTIGHDHEWDVLAEPIRDHIRVTSGQGRIELLPGSGDLDGCTYLDGRLMYASLVHSLPVGPAERVPGYALGDLLRHPGRWRVIVQVPSTWSHVGLIGCRTVSGWTYPSTPGAMWATWADAAEIRLARTHGWSITAVEGLIWRREGRPLTAWRDRLVSLYSSAEDPTYRYAVRSIILHGIGALATGAPTREIRCATPEDVPEDARQVWTDPSGGYRAIVPGVQDEWLAQVSHPEWAATIWARARARLAAQALLLPHEAIVAFRTDAIYLAGHSWSDADLGRLGDLRVKGRDSTVTRWPQTATELLALRERMEA